VYEGGKQTEILERKGQIRDGERLIVRETEGETDSEGDEATHYIYNNHKQTMDWRALFTNVSTQSQVESLLSLHTLMNTK